MKIVNRACVALKRDKKFLILRRSSTISSAGLWEFPGGRVNRGENLIEAAKREVFEETGLMCKKLKFVTLLGLFYDNKFVISHFFICDKFKGKLNVNKQEHDKFKWVTKDFIVKLKPSKEVGTDTWLFFKMIEKDSVFRTAHKNYKIF